MSTFLKSIVGLLILATFQTSTSSCSELTAVEVAQLPLQEFYNSPLFYDGDEWIYHFQTPSGDRYHPVLWRFSVSNFTFEQVAKTTHDMLSYDYSAYINKTGYFFGATGPSHDQPSVIQFNIGEISSEFTSPVHLNFSEQAFRSVAVAHQNDIIIMCGALYCNKIYKLSAGQDKVTELRRIPREHLKPYMGSTVIGEKVFLFGQPHYAEYIKNNTYSIFDMKTLEFQFGRGTFAYLNDEGTPAATTDGEFLYVIPSHRYPTTARVDGFYQINPETNAHQFLTVANFPTQNRSYFFQSPEIIYIEKMNGIFMFGGFAVTPNGNAEHLKEVYFVDLSPLNPPLPTTTTTTLKPELFTCDNHTDGFYPNPFDCSKFIGCYEGVAEYYECPSPLLFDPLLRTCNSPQLVDCEISCSGKDDGLYAHPQDCALFIICTSEDLAVYRCPPPLLFDKVKRICNNPQEANC